MTIDHLALAAQAAADPLRRYFEEIAGFGGHSPPQERAHRSTARKRFLRWPNQTGKTRWGSAETWCHALGEHPYREVPPAPNIGSILCADLQNGWAKLCVKLREVQPPGILADGCTYDPARGYIYKGKRSIGLKNGSLIQAFGSEQPLTALAGDTVSWQWIDEPPKLPHWSEMRRSAAAESAPVWVTLTPIGRPVLWLRDMVEGNPDRALPPSEPDWDVHVGKLDKTHCPHRTQKSIEQQIADTPAEVRAQRIHARWQGVSATRMVPGFSNQIGVDVFTDEDVAAILSSIPDNTSELVLSADYGERPGATVWYLHLIHPAAHRVWTLGEWASEGRLTEIEEAMAIRDDLLRPWNVDWVHIAYGKGDSNSSGRRSVATTINELMERAIARSANLRECPFDLTPPYKGPGSVKARARMINTAILEGRYLVHEDCQMLRQSLAHWTGANDDLKHAWDGASYGVEDPLAPEGSFRTSKYFLK